MAGRHAKFEVCTLWFCDEPHYGRGLCARHYQNWLRTRNPIPATASDTRNALIAVETFRKILSDMLEGNNAYHVTMDGEITIQCRCRYCGIQSRYKHTVMHKQDCPVRLAEEMLYLTAYNPPEDEFTYDLVLEETIDDQEITGTLPS